MSIGVRVESIVRSRRRLARSRAGLSPGVETLEGRVVPSTTTVRNTNDSGPDSLRAAIVQADADTTPDLIQFAPSVTGTITLLSALPHLTGQINLSGPGPSSLTGARSAASGTPNFRIFRVDAGAQVTIAGLTITGGSKASRQNNLYIL